MTTPPYLKPKDKIGIISTARSISEAELQPALSVISDWGFEAVVGKNIYKKAHQFAGSDAERLVDLQTMLDDPEIKAILCARGGYGTVRIIDEVDFSKFLKHPKWLCGYSDVSVLLNKLNNLGVECLHSTMPINFSSNTQRALDSLYKALTGVPLTYEFSKHLHNINGSVEGILVGGNLSMLYSQLGSDTALDLDGKILFLEDLDEYLYHVDRMMFNLARNSYLIKAKGFLIGGMSDMNDNQIAFGQNAEEILHKHFYGEGKASAFGFPAGHLADNCCLIFGRKVKLEVNEKCSLAFYEAS